MLVGLSQQQRMHAMNFLRDQLDFGIKLIVEDISGFSHIIEHRGIRPL